MHQILKNFFEKELSNAAAFVSNRLTVNMSSDDVYEALIGEPHVLKIFTEAAQYLPPRNLCQVVTFDITGGQPDIVRAVISLTASDRYPCFLLPKYALRIDGESELAKALATPARVMSEWEKLSWVMEAFFSMGLPADVIAHTFTWMRDSMLDSTWHQSPESFISANKSHEDDEVTKSTIRDLHRQIARILSRSLPSGIPPMTRNVKDVCRSGKKLFAQYHMLQSSPGRDDVDNPVRILCDPILVPESFRRELEGVVGWREQQ